MAELGRIQLVSGEDHVETGSSLRKGLLYML